MYWRDQDRTKEIGVLRKGRIGVSWLIAELMGSVNEFVQFGNGPVNSLDDFREAIG